MILLILALAALGAFDFAARRFFWAMYEGGAALFLWFALVVAS